MPSSPQGSRRLFYVVLLALLALTQWPALRWANRIHPTLLGLPFLYLYLLLLYLAAIVVLILLARRGE